MGEMLRDLAKIEAEKKEDYKYIIERISEVTDSVRKQGQKIQEVLDYVKSPEFGRLNIKSEPVIVGVVSAKEISEYSCGDCKNLPCNITRNSDHTIGICSDFEAKA
jgi:hypothetical protein